MGIFYQNKNMLQEESYSQKYFFFEIFFEAAVSLAEFASNHQFISLST